MGDLGSTDATSGGGRSAGARRLSLSRLAALLAPASLLAACDPPPIRYKMTVEVETPEGLRIGSAVREVRYHPDKGGWFPLGESRSHFSFKGEAVAVDVGRGQTLFALLSNGPGSSDFAGRIPEWLLGYGKGQKPTAESVELYPTSPPPPFTPNGGIFMPKLVRFRDTREPTSVEAVKPDALAESFGPGVKLKRITVQATGEPLTAGIGTRLTWLGIHPETRLDKDYLGSANPNTSQRLSYGDFRRGTT